MHPDYIKRINKVLVHIEDNLDAELSLETVAEIAHYSPFHLHRIFKAVVNEPLNAYIVRKRIERTAMLLIHKPELSITEIYQRYGFNSNSAYSRAFKKFYGQSPTEFRKSNPDKFSKIGQVQSKNGTAHYLPEEYLCNITNLKNWINMYAKTEVKEMPAMDLIYTTHMGDQEVEKAFYRIINWAAPKGLLNDGAPLCRVFHDSFKITDADKVRMSIGIAVSKPVEPDGAFSRMTIEKGKCFVGRFEISVEEFEKAWNSLFIAMNEKGYKKAGGNPYELYRNNPEEHPQKKCVVDLCIPVE